jgi:peptide/nickel transport system substrate-binding protein
MTDLDPAPGGTSGLYAGMCIYDRLLNYDYVNGTYGLSAAQSFENPDPLTYIFKIKPNAKFQNIPPVNGRSVTSEDCAASWQAFVANPRASNKGFFTTIVDRFDTSDPATLVIRLKQPYPWAITNTAFGGPLANPIIPKEIIEAGQVAKVAIGSGPYVLDQFDPNSIISFKRRPDGWHTPERPYIDRIVYQVITDTAARSAALKARQIDYLLARDKLEAEEFRGYGPDMQTGKELAPPAHLLMRGDESGLFKDPRVREAVYCALDIKEIIDTVDLGDGEMSGPIPPDLKRWSLPTDEIKKVFPHDVAKAKELLAAAGWDSNREVEYKHPTGARGALLAEIIQKQLATVGIKTQLKPEDSNTIWYPKTILGRDFQLTSTGTLLSSKDPDSWLRTQTTMGIGAGNACRWSDSEVDAMVAQVSKELDTEKQRALIMDAQRLILKKFVPFVNLYAPYQFAGCWAYYYPPRTSDAGYVASYGHTAWLDVDHPSYPRR